MIITLLVIVSTLILSALFSGSEIAYVSANKLGIEVMKNKGQKKGRILARLYENPNSFLATMLIGNNIVLVIFTISMTKLLEPFVTHIIGNNSMLILLIVTILITIVVLIFGEFLPKTFFQLYSNELLFRLVYPLRFFKWLLTIPTYLMTSLSSILLKMIFKVDDKNVSTVLTVTDLEHFIEKNVSEKEKIDKYILSNALHLNQIKIRDCMIPRTEIISADITSPISELMDTFLSSKHSRILITENEDINQVIGYIHHHHFIDTPKTIRKIIMPISYVPDAMNIQDLMTKFKKEGANIACVVDEFGGTAGLITMEDILEEIFGEIEDEHDENEFLDKMISDTEYLFSGRIEIDLINKKYENINLPESNEYNTISGYIVMTAEEIPNQGDEIYLDPYKFIIEKESETKIELIRLIITKNIVQSQNTAI